MALKLNKKDYDGFDRVIKQLLEWHKNGEVTDVEVCGVINHLIAAAAIDNGDELKKWADDPDVLARWRSISS